MILNFTHWVDIYNFLPLKTGHHVVEELPLRHSDVLTLTLFELRHNESEHPSQQTTKNLQFQRKNNNAKQHDEYIKIPHLESMIMIRHITILFTIYCGLKISPECHAFDVSPGGKRPMAASTSRMISSINPKPLRAVAIKPLAKEGSWNAYLDDEETGLVYYFNTLTGERTW